MDATSYQVLGFPTVADAAATYTATAILNGSAGASGSITLPATAGVSWNGGSVGAAGSVGFNLNDTSQSFTAKLAAGSYGAIALTHSGLGFTLNDVTLPSSLSFSGPGIGPTPVEIAAAILAATVPMSNTPGTVADCLNAARAQGFGRWTIVGNNLNLYGHDGTTVVRTFVLDNPDDARART